MCIVLSSLILVFSLTSCSEDKPNVLKASVDIDDSVRLKLPVSRSDSFDPFEAETDFNRSLSTLIFDSLIRLKNDFSYEKVIAKDIVCESTAIVITLKDNLLFSDGTKLTADDVEYSFNRAAKSNNYKARLENFQSAASSGADTIMFTLKGADIFAVNCLDFPVMKKNHKKNELIGSGKYKFENPQTLIMNESWFEDSLPAVRRIELVNMLDIQSGVAAVEAGSISYLLRNLNEGSFQRVKAKTHEIPMLNLVYLGINSGGKDLSKSPVRQAISLMIDKQSIVKNSFMGFAQAAKTPFHPAWTNLKSIKVDMTDINSSKEEAVSLLSEAGYNKTNDFVARKDENAISLSLIVNSDNLFKVAAANEIASDLKFIGLNITVKKMKWNDYISALQNGNYDLYIGEIKLTGNMSLKPFFSPSGAARFGITNTSSITEIYEQLIKDEVSLQKFIDSFDIAVPFIPICYRNSIAIYTGEMSYSAEGIAGDIFKNIYTWKY